MHLGMAVAPTVLVIGDELVVRPYVEALSSIWLTAVAAQASHLPPGTVGAGSGDAVLVELSGDGCNVKVADERLRLAQRPSPEDLTALVGLVIRISEFDRHLRLVEEMEPLGRRRSANWSGACSLRMSPPHSSPENYSACLTMACLDLHAAAAILRAIVK